MGQQSLNIKYKKSMTLFDDNLIRLFFTDCKIARQGRKNGRRCTISKTYRMNFIDNRNHIVTFDPPKNF